MELVSCCLYTPKSVTESHTPPQTKTNWTLLGFNKSISGTKVPNKVEKIGGTLAKISVVA